MIYSYKVNSLPNVVPIGYVGEKNHRQIDIDITDWLTEMPDGVPSIVHMRPGETEEQAYVAATTYSDGVIHWIITAGDLGAVEGTGSAQVLLEKEENDAVVRRGKSALFATMIKGSIGEPSRTVPAGVQSVLDQMTALKNAAVAAYDGIMEADMNYPIINEENNHWMLWDPLTDQWADSGVSASGVPGPQGEKGDTGDTGPAGPEGPEGPQGAKGDTGEKGDPGDEGPKGETGPAGAKGDKGDTGAKGDKGDPGADGTDGVSPTVEVTTISGGHTVTITDAEGDHSFNVMDGADGADGQDGAPGQDGADGQDGQDGVSPTVSTATITGGHSVTITDAQGDHTFNVMDGEDGATGQTGPAGPGVASGGTAGQVLKKSSSTDYATEWGDPIEFEGGTFDYDDIHTFTAGHEGIVNWLKVKIEPVQAGSGDPSPSNPRAISGFTSENLRVTGNNLVIPNDVSTNRWLNGTGQEENNNAAFITGYIPFKSGDSIYIPATGTARRCTYDKNKVFKQYLDVSSAQVLTPNFDGYLRVSCLYTSYTANTLVINYGSSAQTPNGVGNKYTISFPTSAGTVYGGELTVNADGTGKLVVDRKLATFNGTENWSHSNGWTNTNLFENSSETTDSKSYSGFSNIANAISNVATVKAPNALASTANNIGIGFGSGTHVFACIGTGFNRDPDAFKTYLASNPLQIVYELAEPIIYDLSAPQIRTLLLTNLWCDTGDCSFQYSESVDQGDTTTAVTTGEKANWNNALNRLTDILDMLAFREAGFTATETHQQDTVIVVGTELYRTTAAIPAGNDIIPGTNCTKTTIIDEIVRLTT